MRIGNLLNANQRLSFPWPKCSLLLIVRHILENRNDHPSLVSHGGRTPGTLDFANAFLFPGVNCRMELLPLRAVGTGKNKAGCHG